MTPLVQRDEQALGKAVEGMGQKQDPHRSSSGLAVASRRPWKVRLRRWGIDDDIGTAKID
jgi:hypothetical protein